MIIRDLAILSILVIAIGCGSVNQSPAYWKKRPQLIREQLQGDERVFSSFGFALLDMSQGLRLSLAYDKDGHLDAEKLRLIFPDAVISTIDDYVAIRFKEGAFDDAILSDEYLASLDPKMNKLITELSDSSSGSSHGSFPIYIPPSLLSK